MKESLDEIIENKIYKLVEKCKTNADKYGNYITVKEDYSLLDSKKIKRVIALIEEDKKYICITKETSELFETKKNPNYKKWYHIEWFTLIVAAILSIIGTIITNQLSNRGQDQLLQKISDSVVYQKNMIDSLNAFLYNHLLDSTNK